MTKIKLTADMLARPNPYARLKLTHPKVIDIFESPRERVKNAKRIAGGSARTPPAAPTLSVVSVRTGRSATPAPSFRMGWLRLSASESKNSRLRKRAETEVEMNITEEEYQELMRRRGGNPPPEKKKSKYNAKKTWIDGICFDSKAEANYYAMTKMLVRAGELHGFLYHGKIVCTEGEKSDHRAVLYEPDFVLFKPDGTYEIIDVKGMETPVFKNKIKSIYEKYPKIKIKIEHGG